MKLFSSFRKKTACGLDVGHNWAKVVRLLPARNGAVLDRAGRLAWSRAEKGKSEQISSKLKTLWSSLNLKDRTVITSLAGHAVIIKRVDLPATKPKELESTIQKQARQHIPFDLDDVYLDYQVMGSGTADKTQNVVLVASKKKVVQELQDLFDKANLGASILDVDGFALSNCFEFNYPERREKQTYLLDVGAVHSTFCVYADQQPIFIRDAGFGGQQLTDHLCTALDKKPKEIEQLKIQGPEGLEAEDQDTFARETEQVYRSWAQEIQRLINFYMNSLNSPEPAQSLFLSGGGSLSYGLNRSLSSQMDLEVDFLDPWRQLSFDDSKFDSKYLQQIGPQFAISTGLALRTIL